MMTLEQSKARCIAKLSELEADYLSAREAYAVSRPRAERAKAHADALVAACQEDYRQMQAKWEALAKERAALGID